MDQASCDACVRVPHDVCSPAHKTPASHAYVYTCTRTCKCIHMQDPRQPCGHAGPVCVVHTTSSVPATRGLRTRHAARQ